MNKEIMTSIFYKWIGYMEHAHVCDEEKCVYFCNEKYHAFARFYEEFNTIELSIQDKTTKENVFYLHFEILDMKMTKENILSFFQFLKEGKQDQLIGETIDIQPMKILLSCTSGLTSSYFATLLQDIFCKSNHDVQVSAISVFDIEHVQKDYDIIFIAPQVSYMYPELRKRFGHKVMKIDAIDYASYNVKKIIHNMLV